MVRSAVADEDLRRFVIEVGRQILRRPGGRMMDPVVSGSSREGA
jgi:hypothetical protein